MKSFLKKTVVSLLVICCLVCLIPQRAAAATSVLLTGPGTAKAGDSVVLSLTISGSGTYGFSGTLSYGDNLTLSDYSCKVSGWSMEVNGNNFSAYGTSTATGTVLTVTLKVSSKAAASDTLTASFSDVVGSDGENDLNLGKTTWSGSVAAPLSNNCDLTAIIVTNATLSPTFNKDTTRYTAKVPYSVQKLNLDYNRADKSTQTVTISGNGNFVVGENTVTLTVKSAAGTTKAYTIVVTREKDPNYKPSDDATLSTLTVEGATLSPKFDPEVLEYIAFVPHETEEVTVTGTPNSKKALGVADAKKSLTEDGETTCTVVCTAEDGTSKKTYTVHVYRLPAYTGGIPLIEFTNEEDIKPEVPEVVEVVPTTFEIPKTVELPLLGETPVLVAGGVAAGLLVVILFLLGMILGRVTAPNEEEYVQEMPREPKQRPHPEEKPHREVKREVYFEPVEEESVKPAEVKLPEPTEEQPESAYSVNDYDLLDEDEQEAADRVKGMSLDDLLDDIHNM